MTPGSNDDALQRAMFALNGQQPIEAAQIANAVLKADPHHVRARHILGCALLMQGRVDDAIAAFETAARGRHDPEIDTQLAIALRQAGRPEDALLRLKSATKRRPPFAAAFRELGALLIAMERYDEAIEALKRGLDIAPMMPELSFQLGYVFLQRKDYANAKAAFARALNLSPGFYDALFGMAKAHQAVGENQAAADYFRRCLTSRPDPGTWLNLGRCLLKLGKADEGYECFRWAVRGDPARYPSALGALIKSPRGRFWLRPSAAARFFAATKD